MSKIPPSQFFPPVECATSDGALVLGDAPFPELVLDALIHGIFPWPATIGGFDEDYDEDCDEDYVVEDYDVARSSSESAKRSSSWLAQQEAVEETRKIMLKSVSSEIWQATWNRFSPSNLPTMREDNLDLIWWSPDPRAIYELSSVHVPKRLARTIKSGKFVVTFDEAFCEVVLGCALAKERSEEGSWITREIYAAYCQLHKLGYAHSVECWLQDEYSRGIRRLVGGLYGVAINGFFDGESMFSIETDASKVAFFALVDRIKARGFKLFDLQVLNAHTARLGGVEIPRDEYMRRLEDAASTPVRF